ncbi:MAG TPA: patatin-like phospholipase family protein [Bryobacteraceae bacterium]|nr:patatin-like phospholipase family protein [Bryobacteraceae bacterium]
MPKSFSEKLARSGQKKLLACDGGGIRGVLSLRILKRVETLLREQAHDPALVLADYFDYIAGTSTGAIIAAFLATGMDVDRIIEFYHQSGPAMFSRASLLKRFWYKYDDQALSEELQQVFGKDTRLGDPAVRTLLMLVMRNATTDSAWPVSNNPSGAYNESSRANCNLKLPLWQLVRASTAAPSYFPPEQIQVGSSQFMFVDGGTTSFNNPAFQLFLMATAQPYHLQWQTGTDKMLLVSVGTGTTRASRPKLCETEMNLLYDASAVPTGLVDAAMVEQDVLCRTFGETVAGGELSRELGTMIGACGPISPKLFTYARYNTALTSEALANLGLPDINPDDVRSMDSTDHLAELEQIGDRVADQQVQPSHFFPV